MVLETMLKFLARSEEEVETKEQEIKRKKAEVKVMEQEIEDLTAEVKVIEQEVEDVTADIKEVKMMIAVFSGESSLPTDDKSGFFKKFPGKEKIIIL